MISDNDKKIIEELKLQYADKNPIEDFGLSEKGLFNLEKAIDMNTFSLDLYDHGEHQYVFNISKSIENLIKEIDEQYEIANSDINIMYNNRRFADCDKIREQVTELAKLKLHLSDILNSIREA